MNSRRLIGLAILGASGLGALMHAQSRPGAVVAPRTSAPQLVAAAIEAMGGEERLLGLTSLTLEAVGHGWALEQSERPEGPWLSSYTQRTEIRDYAGNRLWSESQRRDWNFPKWSPPVPLIVSGGVAARSNGPRWFPGQPSDVVAWMETTTLAPERLLLTAKAAADLRALPEATLQRVRQQVVSFTRPGQALKLYLNAWTHLPTALDITRNDRLGIWGDVVERRSYSFWTLEKGGLMYPRQTTTEWNGLPFSDETVQTLTVDAAIDETRFVVPDEVKAAFAQAAARPSGMSSLTLDESRAVALADHIVQFPSSFNITVIKQPDGLVILEATTSTAFSQQVIAAATRRFPGAPIKAVVTTSDAWPHIGGIREYVARGTPIYALDLNVSILTRLINAPHTFEPDALSKQQTPPIFRPVSGRMTIGTGDTRIELIPSRGETGERMMLVWFPAQRLLYSSDLIQRGRPTGFFMIAMPAEVVDAAAREKLATIDRVFGMHLTPTPWTEVTEAVRAVRGR